MSTGRPPTESHEDEGGVARSRRAVRGPAGAARRWRIDAAASGARIDAWLARQAEVGSRARAAEWIERGKVFLNGRELGHANAGVRLRGGDLVELWVDRPGTAQPRRWDVAAGRLALRIAYEDSSLLVADKPAGVIVEPLPGGCAGRRHHGAGGTGPRPPGERDAEVTLLDLVEDHLRTDIRSRAHVVHRIDRDTTGLVLFAKTETAWADLKRQFASRSPERVYLALVEGAVSPPSGDWRDRLAWNGSELRQQRARAPEARGKDAVAHYRVVEQFRDIALVEVRLETGKRNQIRVQAGLRGHPIVGEKIYRFRAPREDAPAHRFLRQALHAWRLAFRHPARGTRVVVTAPLPDDMRQLLDALGKERTGGGARPRI